MSKTKKQLEASLKRAKKELALYHKLYGNGAFGRHSDDRRNPNFCKTKSEAETITAGDMAQLLYNEISSWGMNKDCRVQAKPDESAIHLFGFYMRYGGSMFHINVEKFRKEYEGGVYYNLDGDGEFEDESDHSGQ